jgi:hypothetical protein
MASIPLFGFGSGRKSPNVSTQARINCYAEKLAEPDKAPIAFYARPGLAHLNLNFAATDPRFTGPLRGMCVLQTNNGAPANPMLDYLVVVAGGCPAVLTSLGDINVGNPSGGFLDPVFGGTGPVRMATDGSAVVALDGTVGHWIAGVTPLSIRIPDTSFTHSAKTVCFLGGRFFCDDPTAPGRFRWSDLYNGQSWPALNYATAEQNPDPLTGVFEAHGQLLLFGTRTLEFWALQASGYQGTQPVTSVQGTTLMWGTEAYDTIRKVGDVVVFMGRNNNGDRKVLMLQGYQAQPISTPDIEADIQADGSPDMATALVMMKAGHTFYVLNLSTKSWAYNLESGNWDIWMSEGSRFAGQWQAAAFAKVLVSDYRDQRIHQLDVNYLTDDGAVMVREMTSRHLFDPNLARMPVSEIVIDMQTGVGVTVGQGSNPEAMLQWSKDGGHTWGNEVWQTIGAIGAYLTRAAWRFLGISRDWNFRLRITDPVTTAVVGANMKVGP